MIYSPIFVNITSRGVNIENLQATRNRCFYLCNVGLHHSIAKTVLPNQYLPFLRRSKFNSVVVSSHWMFSPSHWYECLVRVTRTCMIHVRIYVRFCDTRTNRMVSSESLVRVSRMCITTFKGILQSVRGSQY